MEIKKIMKQMLLSVLAFFLLLFAVPVDAFAVTQAEIDEIQRKKDELAELRDLSQKKVDNLKAEQASVLEQKAALDESNQFALEQLDLIAEQIGLYDEIIKEKAKEVDAAQKIEAEQLERYRTHVRAMEEEGEFDFFSLLAKTASLSELLTLIDDVGEIMESDQRLENEYIAAREEAERVLAEYEEIKTDLTERQAVLKTEQAELEAQIEEAYLMIVELQDDIDQAIVEYELNAAAEQARQQEAQKAAGNNSSEWDSSDSSENIFSSETVTGTGSFSWPVPSCTLITSRYGYRMHPILGYERFHSGLDIGASDGSTIVAADGGTVSEARYNDSYGNYVLINHGNGYSTVYAHMSSSAVTEGQTVSQGETIGYVGSTGWATGPHCHFEIRCDGATTDPASYFTGLTYYNC